DAERTEELVRRLARMRLERSDEPLRDVGGHGAVALRVALLVVAVERLATLRAAAVPLAGVELREVVLRERLEGLLLLDRELVLGEDRVRGLRVLRGAVALDLEGPLLEAVLLADADEVLEEHHALLEDLHLLRVVEGDVQRDAQRGLRARGLHLVVDLDVLAVD